MKILNFLVSDRESDFRCDRVIVTGVAYIPVGMAVPAIVKGKGCVGLADISKVIITENSTMFEFKLLKQPEKDCEGYYALYKVNTLGESSVSNGDYLSNTDQLIPGMVGIRTRTPDNKKSNKRNKRSESKFGSFIGDDW